MGQSTPLRDVNIGYSDTSAIDAFGRLRVANPTTIWDSQFQYDLQPLYYDNVLATNGTITHSPNESCANVNVTTESGSKAIIQSFDYFRYQPGKSSRVDMTYVFAAPTTNLDQRAGQFDDNNGFFLEMTSSIVNIVRRTKTSGSVVNNKTAQADWNIDTMDGAGPSNIILDHTKGQILHIDYQWLSFGRIRYGFDIGGAIHYVHEELISNILDVPSTTTANLPVRWEMVNTGVIAGARTMKAICVSVTSEGGQELQTGYPFEFAREAASAGDGVEEVLLAIRSAATLNSIAYHGKIIPLKFSFLAATSNCHWRLRYKPTTMTGASWQNGQTHSGVQTDIATTTISGGIVIDGGFIAAGLGTVSGESSGGLLQRLPLTLDADGTQTIALALTIEGVGGTTSVDGSLSWEELR